MHGMELHGIDTHDVLPTEVNGFLPDGNAWAAQTFGAVELGDRRRTRRLVETAAAMVGAPQASLPRQLHAPHALKAVYRLLANEAVTYEALLQPHWTHTRHAAGQEPVVLLVQDTTDITYSHHPTTTGLGPIGDGRGRGYRLQSVLAVVPEPRRVLGLAHLEPFVRQPAPGPETCAERQRRPRESEVWTRAVEAVGPPPDERRWVHVGDAYSDIFAFLAACRAQRTDFLIRAAQDRRIQREDATRTSTFPFARALPVRDEQVLALPARPGKPARTARLAVSWGRMTVLPPKHSPKQAALPLWVVRVWEPNPPPEGEEPVEWVLLTSVPTTTVAEAWERVAWYRCRWVVEDYHQCLKTGCQIEGRRLGDQAPLWRLLGICAPIAVRLLQLREAARLTPEQPARAIVPSEVVEVVAALAGVAPSSLTVDAFWREVARRGGYLGRRGDGPPGWKTLWHGWSYIQTLLLGVHLAARLPPS